MRRRLRSAAVLLGAGSLVIGCRFDSGTEPERESAPTMSGLAGQCLAPPSAAADDSTLIRTRLASRLPRGGILCLAPEGSRWVLRTEAEP